MESLIKFLISKYEQRVGRKITRREGLFVARAIVFATIVGIFFVAHDAKAVCAVTPDIYTMGTGVNVSGLCTAVSTGEMALATADLSETQNASLLKQADQYAKQLEEVQNLIIQTEMMVNDLEENPFQVVVPDANQIIANQQRINDLAESIATNSSRIGQNAMRNLEHPDSIGLGKGSKFALWSEARRRNVEESYAKVNTFLKDLKKENEYAEAERQNAAKVKDKTQAEKTDARIAAAQLAALNKMLELLNQLLGAQAVTEGAKITEEIEGQKAFRGGAKDSHGVQIDADTYAGPGKSGASPF